LAAYPGFDGNGQFVHKDYHYRRQEWFDCACCPPNIARMIAQFPGYMYSAGRDEVYVHLYAQSTAHINIAGQTVQITQKTAYPWKGKIVIAVKPEKASVWTLALRIPGWCRGAELRVNGKAVEAALITKKGYARISREWKNGDRVELVLPMPPERIEAHPAVRQDCGRIALQRGPLVYCLEEADNGPGLNDIVLPRSARLAVKNNETLLDGSIPVIMAWGKRRSPEGWKDTSYRRAGSKTEAVTCKAIPYFMWANRQPGELLVWIRET